MRIVVTAKVRATVSEQWVFETTDELGALLIRQDDEKADALTRLNQANARLIEVLDLGTEDESDRRIVSVESDAILGEG